jgi:hypothetical protein|tara:strand:- start:125 stop:454 length:330 start_codon:yes stop_codon:yes gene_type:complete
MASTFKNSTVRAVGTTATDIGVAVPVGTEVTVIGLSCANITASQVLVSITVNDGSNTTNIVKDVPIPSSSSLIAIGGDQKVVLMTGDKVVVTSNIASSVDVIMSFLEIT